MRSSGYIKRKISISLIVEESSAILRGYSNLSHFCRVRVHATFFEWNKTSRSMQELESVAFEHSSFKY